MASYPIVGENSIYNRTTFNTTYLDTTEIDINNIKTVIEENKESFTTRVINSLDVKTVSINDQTFPAETIEQITINKDDIVDINNDLTEFKNDASIVNLTVTGDASFNCDVSFTENVDIEGILQIQDRDVLEELTGINDRVEELESGGGGGDNLNVVGTLDVGGQSTFNSAVTINSSGKINYGETTFNVVVLRRTQLNGIDDRILGREIQLWVNGQNNFQTNVNIPSDSQNTNNFNNRQSGFYDWPSQVNTNDSRWPFHNAFNRNWMLGSFKWGDFNTNAQRVIDLSKQAGIIFMKTPIKITDVQSLVYYGAPNQHASMTTGIGLSIELYNDTNDRDLNNPLIIFPQQTNAQEVYRYDFPSFNSNLSFSTIPSFDKIYNGNNMDIIVPPNEKALTVQGDIIASIVYYTTNLIGTSDDRIKSHERDIVDATETLNKLTPKIYDKHPFFKVDSEIEDTDLSGIEIVFKESGLIAQEVMNNVPELDHLVIKPNDSDGLYSLNYIGLIPYLIKSNNELNERLKLLEGI